MAYYNKFKQWLLETSLITESDFEIIENHLTLRHIKENEYFLKEGEVCTEIGFINTGSFRTFYIKEDKEINTRFFFENDIVEEYDSFISHKHSKYFIQAIENAEIVCFNLPTLQKAFDATKNWERLGRIFAEAACIASSERIESLLFLTGEERYMHLLQNQPEIFNRLPLFHIASYLGMERESLSRIRRKIMASPIM